MTISLKRLCTLVGILVVTAGAVFLLQVGLLFHSTNRMVPGIPPMLSDYTYLGNDDVILQQEDSDCGPAALMNVFVHYGIGASIEKVKTFVGTMENGTSMLKLKQMAELKGLSAEGWIYMWEDFRKIDLPAIVLLRSNHYVVVESIPNERELILIDPAIGRMMISQREFLRIWSGETLQMQKADAYESAS
ncbi:MAG: cysteine peptidase family C39 domain-containing protein [Candidatus Neomarinimicrobiota bacterium]